MERVLKQGWTKSWRGQMHKIACYGYLATKTGWFLLAGMNCHASEDEGNKISLLSWTKKKNMHFFVYADNWNKIKWMFTKRVYWFSLPIKSNVLSENKLHNELILNCSILYPGNISEYIYIKIYLNWLAVLNYRCKAILH